MYIRKAGEIYMLDRDNAVFSVPQLKFPSRKVTGQHLKETLVDGVNFVLLIPWHSEDVVSIGDGSW